MTVLELNHLVNISGRRRRCVLHTWCILTAIPFPAIAWVYATAADLTGLQFGLLTLLVQLAILVWDVENFTEALWWLKVLQIARWRLLLARCMGLVWVFSLTFGRFGLLEKVKLKVDKLNVAQVLGAALCVQIYVGTLVVEVTTTSFKLVGSIRGATLF